MELSVVIIVYNQEIEIPYILEGFLQQEGVDFQWELIIVDDGSEDNTVEIVKTKLSELPIQLVELTHSGNRQKNRNTGMHKATGRRIAFLDGDIIPRQTYLREHALCPVDTVLLGSRTNTEEYIYQDDYLESIREDLYMIDTIPWRADERIAHFWKHPLEEHAHKWRFVHSHNFSLSGKIAKELKGFNEQLCYWGADDIEFGYRMYLKKLHFKFSHKAGGIHFYHKMSFNFPTYYKNLVRFLQIHKHNAIELFFIEYMLSPEETFTVYHRCKDTYMQKINTADCLSLEGDIITNNLDIENTDKTTGIGIYIDEITKLYDYYLINGSLAELGLTVFHKILENGLTIAKQIIVYDSDGSVAALFDKLMTFSSKWTYYKTGNFLHVAVNKEKPPVICEFSYESFLDFSDKDFFRSHIMQALRTRVLCYHAEKLERNIYPDNFLKTEKYIMECYNHVKTGPVFLFHWAYATYEKDKYKFPVSVFYENYNNSYTPDDLRELNSIYDILFFFSKENLAMYNTIADEQEKKAFYIPPSINISLFKEDKEAYVQENFTFLIIRRYPDAGMCDSIEAFKKEFQNEKDLRLIVILSKHHNIDYENAYFDFNKNLHFTNWANVQERINQMNIEKVPKFQDPRVTVHRLDLTETELVDWLNRGNAFIDLNVNKTIPFFAAWALLSGIHVIIGEHNKSFFPLEDKNLHYIESKTSSGHIIDTVLRLPIGSENLERNTLRKVYYPSVKELQKVMRRLYTGWREAGKIKNYALTAQWRQLFDAQKNSKKIIEILNTYLSTEGNIQNIAERN